MQLELKRPEDCMFDEISLGEIMLRLDPGAGRIKNSRSFTAWEGGGEYIGDDGAVFLSLFDCAAASDFAPQS